MCRLTRSPSFSKRPLEARTKRHVFPPSITLPLVQAVTTSLVKIANIGAILPFCLRRTSPLAGGLVRAAEA